MIQAPLRSDKIRHREEGNVGESTVMRLQYLLHRVGICALESSLHVICVEFPVLSETPCPGYLRMSLNSKSKGGMKADEAEAVRER